ncbi:MAG: cysteine hydrolase [Anaerolinea sp.]|nr:cysteine hydrolase [Anaerolinea sp.]
MSLIQPGSSPRRALLLVDVINAFFDERGAFHYPAAGEVLPALRGLLETARRAGRLVVHAREAHHPGLADHEEKKLPRHCLAGEFDAAFFPGLEPAGVEVEVRKRRYSAFFATDLALLLAEQGVEEVLVVGVKTNVCIRATVQDAFAHGFRPVVVRGASNSNRPHLHEAVLEDVVHYFGEVVDLDEAVRRLEVAG